MFNIQDAKNLEANFDELLFDTEIVPLIKEAVVRRKTYIVYSLPNGYGIHTRSNTGNLGRIITLLLNRGFDARCYYRRGDITIRLVIWGWSSEPSPERGRLDRVWEPFNYRELIETNISKNEEEP